MPTKGFLCARCCSNCFTCVISFNPHNMPKRQMRGLGYREVKELIKDHKASKW